MRGFGKTKMQTMLVIGFIIIAPLLLGMVYIHDNPPGITLIANINSGEALIGTNITVKGNITEIFMLYAGPFDQTITLTDGQSTLKFYWSKSQVGLGWIIVVSGTINSNNSLNRVTSVERVWIFI